MGFPNLVVEFSPGEGPFDTPSWVDLSARALRASWSIGRQRDLDEWPSGEATIVLDNSDRVLDPEYAAGTYYGTLDPRTPFRIRTRKSALDVDGTAGTYAEHEACPAIDLTSSIDIRAYDVLPDAWSAADYQTVVGTRSGSAAKYLVTLSTAGKVGLYISDAGGEVGAEITHGFTNGVAEDIRVTWDDAANLFTLYHRVAGAWVSLGTAAIARSGIVSSPTSTLFVGARVGAGGSTFQFLNGTVGAVEVLNGIDGTLVSAGRFEYETPTAAGGTFRDAVSGKTWTLRGSAAITASGEYRDEFYGFVEDGFEQTYEPPAKGTCTVRLVDMLGVLAGSRMPEQPIVPAILADSPVAYWPLDEQSGTVLRDVSGNGHDLIADDGLTSHSATAEFGTQTVRGIEFDGTRWARNVDPTIQPSAPFTLLAIFKAETAGGTLIHTGRGVGGSGVDTARGMLAHGTDTITAHLADEANLATVDVSSTDVTVPNEEPIMVHGSWDGSSQNVLTLNGGEGYTQGFISIDGPRVISGVYVGHGNGYTAERGHDGFLAHVAIFATELTSLQIAAHYEAATNPWDGDTTGERIGRVLDAIGYPAGLRDLDTGLTTLGPADYETGSSVLDYLRTVARTEVGALYVNHHDGGKLRFRDRYDLYTASRSATSVLTLTDADTPGAIHYERGSLVVEPNGIASVINQVSCEWTGGTLQGEDATSVAAYGPQGISIQTIAPDPTTAGGLIDFLLAQYAQPQTRVRGLAVFPSADVNAYDAALGLGIGDRVTVRRLPQGVGTEISSATHVEGVEHEVENGVERKATFYLSNAATGSIWIWDTSLWDSTTKWGY
jgi:hypothetical protein